MTARGRELVATDEPAVVSEPFLDAIMVEDGQSERCFPNPAWTDESGWSEIFSETDDLLNQLVASETDPRPRWRGLPRCVRFWYKILGSLVIWTVDPA